MNFPRKNVNNLLFVPKSGEEYVENMYSALLQLISKGDKTIVVLTQSAPKLLSLMSKLKIELHRNKEILQRLIFIKCENVTAAIRKLFDLHDWTIKPHIVVIDFYTFARLADDIDHSHLGMAVVPFLQQLVYCTAALFNLMNSLGGNVTSLIEQQQLNGDMLAQMVSIVVLKEHSAILSSTQIGLLQELYYGDSTYDDFKVIVEKLK